MYKYAVSIKWSDEDNGFIATIPGIKGLSAFGVKQEEAFSELIIVAEAYFKSLKKAGRPFPAEEKIIPYSGQIRLRMPKSLHAALANSAANEGVSLNTYIIASLSERRIENELLKKVKEIEKTIKVTNFTIVSDAPNMAQSIYEKGKLSASQKEYKVYQ